MLKMKYIITVDIENIVHMFRQSQSAAPEGRSLLPSIDSEAGCIWSRLGGSARIRQIVSQRRTLETGR